MTNHLDDALSALLDGELTGTQEAAAHAHLLVCPECTAELVAVRQARYWVRALPPVDAPFGFYERMLLPAKVRMGTLSLSSAQASVAIASTPRRRASLAALAAAAVTVTVLGVGSPQHDPVSPPTTSLARVRIAGASFDADLLSKLEPVVLPVSYRH